MAVRCVQITESLRLEPLAAGDFMEASRAEGATTWLDLHDVTNKEIEKWLDELGIENLGRRLCLDARDRPGYYPLNKEILFVLPVAPASLDYDDVLHLALLCRANQLISLHEKPIARPDQLVDLEIADSWLPERSIVGLVAAVLIDQSLDCLRLTASCRDSVFELEERFLRDPDDVEAGEVLALRSKLVVLAGVVSDQLPVVEALSATDRPFFRLGEAREHMHCALVNLRAADASAAGLDQRISALRAGLQMHAQEKTNRRLGVLTILSAIFVPLTFLAGIWGMNFEHMPELKVVYAYPLALGAMVLIGVCMFRFFRRRGWFD